MLFSCCVLGLYRFSVYLEWHEWGLLEMFVIKSQVLNGCVDASLWGVVKGDFHASEYWASFLSIRNNHTSKSFGFALLQYILSFWQIAECQVRQSERVQSCFDEIQKQKSIDVVKA